MHTSFLFCHSSYCCHSKYCRNRVRRLQTKLCKFWAKRIAKHKNKHQSAVICGLMKVAFCVWFDCLVIVVGREAFTITWQVAWHRAVPSYVINVPVVVWLTLYCRASEQCLSVQLCGHATPRCGVVLCICVFLCGCVVLCNCAVLAVRYRAACSVAV